MYILLSLIIVLLIFSISFPYIIKGIRVVYFTGHTSAFIDDTKYFDTDTVNKGCAQHWDLHDNYNKVTPTKNLIDTGERLGTVAYMIVKNDQIFYENYAKGYSKDKLTNSFSMAKSITTALLFKAIDEGFMKSLDQKVIEYYPEIKGEYAHLLTLGDLASMASGLNWDEAYTNPFSITAQAYYKKNIKNIILGLQVNELPGKSFDYISGATQLLGMCIEKATKQSLSNYLTASFWQPMGMHSNAEWQLDSKESGMTKCYCCLASNARDFARFGQIWMKDGLWNGQQLISKDLVQKAKTARFKDAPQYGYGLWLSDYKNKKISYMRGILGQYVICIPEDDIMIIRLGHKRDDVDDAGNPGQDFYTYIDEAYEMLNQKLNDKH